MIFNTSFQKMLMKVLVGRRKSRILNVSYIMALNDVDLFMLRYIKTLKPLKYLIVAFMTDRHVAASDGKLSVTTVSDKDKLMKCLFENKCFL